ncbi:hypothetical protein GGX14DRAFT_571631 [Mycena pura]|uniref:Uncharacterized protein n=1 Tax=Mycena pura TaxID=153505 RepID=A0AAD6V6K7_9AGAR|nr:hypothetical protein GGX14DRAFT_571631 [Mycena pura]
MEPALRPTPAVECLDVWGAESVSTVVSPALFYLLPRCASPSRTSTTAKLPTPRTSRASTARLGDRDRTQAVEAIPYTPQRRGHLEVDREAKAAAAHDGVAAVVSDRRGCRTRRDRWWVIAVTWAAQFQYPCR